MSLNAPRKLSKLGIKDVKHLCSLLGTTRSQLDRICDNPEIFYRRKTEIKIKGGKEKKRNYATPIKEFRAISDRLKRLLQRIALPECLHGGIKNRSNKTNASVHIGQPMLINRDIKDFFPSIGPRKVYKMFVENLNCAPEPARYLTLLTTLDGGVPQGSPTSTMIANLVSLPLANRLNGLSKKHKANYTQFVDDISISGPAYIERLSPCVKKIFQQEGFKEHPDKRTNASRDEKQVVTGIAVKNGIDAPPDSIRDVRKQIEKLRISKELGQEIPVKEINLMKGRINYIGQLNKGAAKFLRKRFRRILSQSIASQLFC